MGLLLVSSNSVLLPRAVADVLCGTTITSDTSLTHDLHGCPGEGVVIGADGITLDCQGHMLTSSPQPQRLPYNAGVYSRNKQGITIKNCISAGFYYDFLLDSSAFSTLSNNTAGVSTDSKVGFNVTLSHHVTLIDNAVAGTQTGFGVISTTLSIIISNTVRSTSYGIVLDKYSSFNSIQSNIVSSNYTGVDIEGSHNLIFNNLLDSKAYLNQGEVGNSWNTTKKLGVNIIGGPFLGGNFWSDYNGIDIDGDGLGDTPRLIHGSGAGINGVDSLPLTTQQFNLERREPIAIYGNKDFASCKCTVKGDGSAADPYIIEGVQIEGGFAGIRIENTDASFVIRRVYIQSEITGDNRGIQFDNVTHGRIEKAATYSAFGIVVLHSSDILLFDNKLKSEIFQSAGGVWIDNSDNITVSGNNIATGFCGVCVLSSSKITVAGNNIRGNEFGAFLNNSTNVAILNNNFIANQLQACAGNCGRGDGGNNLVRWERNYWSDYTGNDEDGDGIGDTPYVIDGGQDSYPLIVPYTSHDIAVTNVVVSPILVLPGQIVTINVDVRNQGSLSENFTIVVFSNDTEISSQDVFKLLPGSTQTLFFSWNTTTFPLGIYLVKAEAVAPNDLHLSNNIRLGQMVTISLRGILVSPIFNTSNAEVGGHLTIYLQVQNVTVNGLIALNDIPIQLRSPLGEEILDSASVLGVNGVVVATFNLTEFSGNSFSIRIMTTSYHGSTVLASVNPLAYPLTNRMVEQEFGTTLGGEVSGISPVGVEGEMTHRFTFTSDGTGTVSAASVEEWKAGIGVGESPFALQLGDVVYAKVEVGASAGVLGAMNYQFDNPASDAQSGLIQNQISKWILSYATYFSGGPGTLAGQVAGACRASVEADSVELGLSDRVSPSTVGLYGEVTVDFGYRVPNFGFSSQLGVLKAPLLLDMLGPFIVAGSLEGDGKINVYSPNRIGFEADALFRIDAEVSSSALPFQIHGINGNFGGEMSVELIYDSGHFSSLEIGFGVSSQKSALQALSYSGLLLPLNGLQLPTSLPDESDKPVTLSVHYSIPVERLDPRIQSNLSKLTHGDLTEGILGFWQDVMDSMNTLLTTPMSYEITVGSESPLDFELKILGNGVSFHWDSSNSTVLETGFVFNLKKWPVAAYANVPKSSMNTLDYIKQYLHIQDPLSNIDPCALLKTSVRGVGAIVKVVESPFTHHLYLHATDGEGRHTGLNYTTGKPETQIPGSFYLNNPRGVYYIGLPRNLTSYVISVDATYAEQNSENYNTTIVSFGDEHQALGEWNNSSTIFKGSIQHYNATMAHDTLRVSFLPGVWIAKFLTDTSSNPVPKDPSGNWKVEAVFVNGILRRTSPDEVLIWTNVTSTGPASIESLRITETLPADWQISPEWSLSHEAVHVYFEYSNRSKVEITKQAYVTIRSGNPEIMVIEISNITATPIGRDLYPGEGIIVSVGLSYSLEATAQSSSSFPRSYADTVNVKVFTGASYNLFQSDGESGASLTVEAVSTPPPKTSEFPWWQLYLIVVGIPAGVAVFMIQRSVRKKRQSSGMTLLSPHTVGFAQSWSHIRPIFVWSHY